MFNPLVVNAASLFLLSSWVGVAWSCVDHSDCSPDQAGPCDLGAGYCLDAQCLWIQDPNCLGSNQRISKAIADRPTVSATDGDLMLLADNLKKVVVKAGEVKFILPEREPVTVGTMLDAVSTLENNLTTLKAGTEELSTVVDQKTAELSSKTAELSNVVDQKLARVEEQFKATVDEQLTPAVSTLTKTSEELTFRILKLETKCNSASYQKVASSGTDVASFVPPQCEVLRICKQNLEFETKSPTATSDRVCNAATKCNSAQFEKTLLTEKSDRLCETVQECKVGSTFQVSAPTETRDRVCKEVTECAKADYLQEKDKPTATSDRTCKDLDLTFGGPSHGLQTIMTPEAMKTVYDRLGRKSTRSAGWKSMKLCFSGKRDGYDASTFHNKCNGKGPVLLVAKMKNGRVFGGYQHISMTSNQGYVGTSGNGQGGVVTGSGWLFRVDPSNDKKTDIFHHENRQQYGYYRNPSYIMTWGGGHDLSCEQSFSHCYSYLGYGYGNPSIGISGSQMGSTKNKEALAGKYNWNGKTDMAEYEVYAVNQEA